MGSDMEIFLFRSKSREPSPGIVLAQHIPVGHTGIENDEFTLVTAQRFADAGYSVAVPFIFHWWDKSESIETKFAGSRDDWMVADCQVAYDVLANDPLVDSQHIGVVGHCWGGRVAWLHACHNTQLAACAMFYGGRIKIGMGEGSIAPIELAANIPCKVAGFFGNNDKNPTPQDVDDYASALSNAQVHHRFYRYEDAGHAFQNFPTPDRYHEDASEDAWQKLLQFLREELG